jgi:hypothetical protein
MSRRLSLLALGTLASLAGVPQASAGSCCNSCAAPCDALMVAPNAYYYGTQFYVVNEAPSYTGPGIVVLPPNNYPYVGNGCCGVQNHGCCGVQYQAMPQPQVMPYQGEPNYAPEPYYAPEPRYRRIRHRPAVVHRRYVVERIVVREREAPFHPTKRRPFDERDK